MCYTMYNFCEKEDRDLRLIGPVELHVDNFNTMGTEEFNKNINYEREFIYLKKQVRINNLIKCM